MDPYSVFDFIRQKSIDKQIPFYIFENSENFILPVDDSFICLIFIYTGKGNNHLVVYSKVYSFLEFFCLNGLKPIHYKLPKSSNIFPIAMQRYSSKLCAIGSIVYILWKFCHLSSDSMCDYFFFNC